MSRRAKRARAETDAPLAVTIDQLTPSTIPEKGMVRVSGTITNNDTVPWSTINVYSFISDEPLTTPDQLDEAAATPEDAVVGGRITDEQHKDTIAELAPGDHATYSLSIPRSLLHADTPGVYWFGVHALGEGPDGRDLAADGRARTFLPLVPPARPGQEPTAVVIPLRHQLVYTDDGSLDDLASWTQTLSQGGRLRSLVDFGASSGDRTVNWVVDPALIDAVRRLADGNPPRSLAPNLEVGQEDGEDEASGRPVGEHHPDRGARPRPRRRRPRALPTARSTWTSSTRSCRRPPRPRRPGWPGWARRCAPRTRSCRCRTATSTWPPRRRTTRSSTSARWPGPARRCRASTSPPPRCCPRRAAT